TASGSAAPAGPVREVTPPPVTTILLADDEEAVLSFCRRMLMRDGHRVLEARDGVEAVESVRAHPGEIDLILLDMTMPRMGGREAYEAIRALDPAVKVVLSSGFSESETVARFGHAGLAGFLHKPYSAQDLRAMVRDVLSKGA
ncbi:MAG: response regulator, partial [Candidatus Sumerlaeia bacterium]|nr:response regulator [Candidatus Sumerlaeia bacterium]